MQRGRVLLHLLQARLERGRAGRVVNAGKQRQTGTGGHGQQRQFLVERLGRSLRRTLVARGQRRARGRRRLARLGDSFLQGARFRLALVGGRHQHLPVDLLDIVAAEDFNVGPFVGIDLVVVKLKSGLLVVANLRRRIGRDDNDQVNLLSAQPAVGLGRVADNPFWSDLVAQALGVVLHDREHRAALRHDKERAQRARLLAIANAEEQQNKEGSQNKGSHQPGLAQDVDNLLAHKGEHADEVL